MPKCEHCRKVIVGTVHRTLDDVPFCSSCLHGEGERTADYRPGTMPEHQPSPGQRVTDLASRVLDMLERVEWVRALGGKHMVCPWCHAVSERDGGPGHQDDCEGEMVRREGNELRSTGGLR